MTHMNRGNQPLLYVFLLFLPNGDNIILRDAQLPRGRISAAALILTF